MDKERKESLTEMFEKHNTGKLAINEEDGILSTLRGIEKRLEHIEKCLEHIDKGE